MCSTPRKSKTAVTAVNNTTEFSGRAQAILDEGATGEEFVLGADEMLHHKPKGTPACGLTGYVRDRLGAGGAAFWDFIVLIIPYCAVVLVVVIIAVCICSLYDKVLGDIPSAAVELQVACA